MATELAKLVIAVGANATGIASDISRDIRKAQGSFAAQGRIIGNALAAGITAGMATMVLAFARGVKQIDDLSAAAQKVGASTSGLAKLELQAKMTDSSFEGLVAGMARMSANIATGKATDALGKLGLDAKELRRLAPEEQLQRINAALGQIGDKGAQLALGKEIFGKGFAEFANLAEASVEQIEEINRIAKVAGLTMSNEMVGAIGEFDNATHAMVAVWDGFGRQLAGQLAPTFKNLTSYIIDLLESWGGMPAVVSKVIQFVQNLGHAIAFAMHKADEMQYAIEEWATSGIAKALGGVAELTRALGEMVETTISGFRNLTNEMIGGIETTINSTKVARLGLPKWLGGTDSVTATKLDRLPEVKGHSAALFEAGADKIDEAKKSMEGLNLETQVYRDQSRLAADEVANLMNMQEEQNKVLLNGSEVAQKANAEILDIEDKKEKEMKVRRATLVKDTKDAFDEMRAANRDMMTDMVTAWITGTGKMSDIVNQWANQTVKRIVDVLLFGSGRGDLTGAGGLIGNFIGAGSSGFWGGVASGVGALFGGARASGGPVNAGRSYLVGERGPEMFMPRNSGTIVPNGGGGGVGSATINNFNQTFQPGVSRIEMMSMMDGLEDRMLNAVLAANERGGSFRRRLRG